MANHINSGSKVLFNAEPWVVRVGLLVRYASTSSSVGVGGWFGGMRLVIEGEDGREHFCHRSCVRKDTPKNRAWYSQAGYTLKTGRPAESAAAASAAPSSL